MYVGVSYFVFSKGNTQPENMGQNCRHTFFKKGSLAKSCFSLVKSCFTLGTMGCFGQCSTGGVWGTGQGGTAPQDVQPEGVALQWRAGNRVEGVCK